MNILVTGGTGFVGKLLINELIKNKHNIFIVSRKNIESTNENIKYLKWSELDRNKITLSIEAVVNLAGENIANNLWTKNQKKKIYDSRINTSKALVNYFENKTLPNVIVSASAVGYYQKNSEINLSEDDCCSDDFLGNVCKDWENVILESKIRRKVIFRIAPVLGNGGMMSRMIKVFRQCIGSVIGSGNQIMPWIHVDDLVSMINWALENKDLNGVYNAVAPEIISNRKFTEVVAQALKKPLFFRIPALIIKIILGELSSIILDGQIISSKKVIEAGFNFRYKKINDAVSNIIDKQANL